MEISDTKHQVNSSYILDQLILDEKEKIISVYFEKSTKQETRIVLKNIFTNLNAERKNLFFIYVNCEKVFDFDFMYELFESPCILFFYKNKHILIDTNTGNNNKLDRRSFDSENLLTFLHKMVIGIKKGKNMIY